MAGYLRGDASGSRDMIYCVFFRHNVEGRVGQLFRIYIIIQFFMLFVVYWGDTGVCGGRRVMRVGRAVSPTVGGGLTRVRLSRVRDTIVVVYRVRRGRVFTVLFEYGGLLRRLRVSVGDLARLFIARFFAYPRAFSLRVRGVLVSVYCFVNLVEKRLRVITRFFGIGDGQFFARVIAILTYGARYYAWWGNYGDRAWASRGAWALGYWAWARKPFAPFLFAFCLFIATGVAVYFVVLFLGVFGCYWQLTG